MWPLGPQHKSFYPLLVLLPIQTVNDSVVQYWPLVGASGHTSSGHYTNYLISSTPYLLPILNIFRLQQTGDLGFSAAKWLLKTNVWHSEFVNKLHEGDGGALPEDEGPNDDSDDAPCCQTQPAGENQAFSTWHLLQSSLTFSYIQR